MRLTRELRDNVYEALLSASRSPPVSPEHGGARKYPSKDEEEILEYCNRYPSEGLESTSTSLQLTCRQVHEEVQEAILRLKKSKSLSYKMDLMMLDEAELYPTWLAFPAMIEEIPSLKVDFRIFGDIEGKESALRSDEAGPPLLIWSLSILTTRFLLRGPDFLAPYKWNRNQRIEELAINVLTPSPPPPNGYADQSLGFHDRNRKGLVHPEQVLSFLISYMAYFIRRIKHTASYARIIFERVKRISFSIDGIVRQSWELATLEPENQPNSAP